MLTFHNSNTIRLDGGKKNKLCSVEGCDKQAKKEGVCVRHGKKKLISYFVIIVYNLMYLISYNFEML